MNTNERPTPETDAREQHLRLIAIDHGASREELVIQFGHTARRLERQRDEARDRIAQLEKQLAELQKPKAETFQAHGLTWIKRAPGDPMPCDADASVRVLCEYEKRGKYWPSVCTALAWDWTSLPKDPSMDIIGWNYADAP